MSPNNLWTAVLVFAAILMSGCATVVPATIGADHPIDKQYRVVKKRYSFLVFSFETDPFVCQFKGLDVLKCAPVKYYGMDPR